MKHYKHEIRKVSDLIPYANNSRTHSKMQIKQIASSIAEFGFTNPILIDEKANIIAGHGRVLAAELIEMDVVPCIIVNGLSEAQKKGLVIADNKLALNADWDIDLLKIEIEALNDLDFAMDLLGFSPDDLDELLLNSDDFGAGSEDDQGQLDELDPIWITCPHCDREFNRRDVE